jgi:hypothetical protein
MAAGGEAGNAVKGVDTEVWFDTLLRSVVATWGDRGARTAVSTTAVIPATIPNVTSLSRGELAPRAIATARRVIRRLQLLM